MPLLTFLRELWRTLIYYRRDRALARSIRRWIDQQSTQQGTSCTLTPQQVSALQSSPPRPVKRT